MSKILLGMAAAALWFVFSQAANAERVCKEVCDSGTCVSRCMNDSDDSVIIHERDRDRERTPDRGPDARLRAPGGDTDVAR
jgi:hypothetical protein